MWATREYEKYLQTRLVNALGQAKGEEIYSRYVQNREKLTANILKEIKAAIPKMSDHGEEHIANVLDNAGKLIGSGNVDLTHYDLYALGLSILYHDTGNIFGRKGHPENAARIYDFANGKNKNARERWVVATVAKAHSGQNAKGSNDTLSEVASETSLYEEKIKLREIAAILRFADELAEGKQRTSLFMMESKRYPKANIIFHKYASVTEVQIDRGGGRIALTYDLSLSLGGRKKGEVKKEWENLKKLLEFSFVRINKLDQERRYARFYSSTLEPFKVTTVTFNFDIDGKIANLGLEPLTLTDKIVPGEQDPLELKILNSDYEIPKLISKLKKVG